MGRQVIYATEKYYSCSHDRKSGCKSNRFAYLTANGPFKDPIGKPLITNHGARDIDPTVFIDDDGQAYLYWGNGELYYVKLNKDMVSYSGSVVQVNPKPNGFVEGPWFYKRNNLYYMVYAGMGSNGEDIRYATSNSPTGPWTYRGVLMPSQNSFTNHPGVIDYKGNSYMFYHNSNYLDVKLSPVSWRRTFKYNLTVQFRIPITKTA